MLATRCGLHTWPQLAILSITRLFSEPLPPTISHFKHCSGFSLKAALLPGNYNKIPSCDLSDFSNLLLFFHLSKMVINHCKLMRAWMNIASISRLVCHLLLAKLEPPPTSPQFLEDESGECCSRILQADGHMEYSKVGFPENPLHTQTHAYGRRNLTGYHLSL